MSGSSPSGGETHGEVHGHSTRRLEFLTHWSSRNRTLSWDSAISHRPLSQLPTSHNYSLPLKGLYPLPLKQHYWLRATHELGGARGGGMHHFQVTVCRISSGLSSPEVAWLSQMPSSGPISNERWGLGSHQPFTWLSRQQEPQAGQFL